MKIIGPGPFVFGIDDLDGCHRFLVDYGPKRVAGGSSGGTSQTSLLQCTQKWARAR